MSQRFVFFDTETSGSDVRHDQVLQFAAVVTDADFNEIESVDLRSKRLPYVIPHPKALEVTRITPADLERAEMTAFEFATDVHRRLSGWAPATFAGQNTLRFDREILRTTFWMNLLDPYVMGSRGSRELDILPVMRFIHTADPTAFEVPVHPETGRFVFKLDRIAPLNGFDDGGNAHDALVDVRATVFMAKLARERRPDLFALAAACADPQRNQRLLADQRMLHHLTYFGEPKVQQITKIADHPKNSKQAICFDLAWDPVPFLSMPAEEIAGLLFGADTPFQVIKANAQPILMPAEIDVIRPTEPVERETLVRRLDAIHANHAFREACARALELNAASFAKCPNVEEQIYDGFPPPADKARMRTWHGARSWFERHEIGKTFEDPRLRQISTRLIYVNAPEVLAPGVRERIEEHILRTRLLGSEDAPWTTLAKAEAGLADVQDPAMQAAVGAWLRELRDASEERLRQLALVPSARTAAVPFSDRRRGLDR
jgi:exodeoxyribonuclease-1